MESRARAFSLRLDMARAHSGPAWAVALEAAAQMDVEAMDALARGDTHRLAHELHQTMSTLLYLYPPVETTERLREFGRSLRGRASLDERLFCEWEVCRGLLCEMRAFAQGWLAEEARQRRGARV